MNRTGTLTEDTTQQARSLSEVWVAWQYKDDPEWFQREYQFLGVFSTPELASDRTSAMRTSGWTVQVTRVTLDPEEVC